MIRLMYAVLLTSLVVATLSVEELEAQVDTKEDVKFGHDEKNSLGAKETSEEIDKAWIDTIRDAFLKIGIKPEELPEPFGPKQSSNITISPEYANVIRKIIDSVPNNLRESLETMITNATINIGQNNNGTVEEKATSRLQKIAGIIKLVEAVEHLMNHTKDIVNATTKNEDKNNQNISTHDDAIPQHANEIETTANPTDEITFKYANKNEKKTFCDEKEGPCEESDDEESNNEIDDEKELDQLIEELRGLVSELPPQDNLQGQKDLDNVQRFLNTHYLANHVNNIDNDNNDTSHNSIVKSTHDTETTTETVQVITSITTQSLAAREQFIQERMKESGSPTDVSIVGNSQKEIGAQFGKIAVMNHERHINATPENKKAESSAINNLFQDIDKVAKEVGKQDLEAIQKVTKNGNHTKESLKTIDLQSILVSGLEDERDDEKVKSNQNEHDKHKKIFIDNIKSLRFTGDPDTDAQTIKKILAIIAAIDREHRDAMELNKIMSSKNHVKKSHKKTKKREKQDADKLANKLLGTAFKGQDVSISKRYRKKKINKINHNQQHHQRKSKVESEMDKELKEENENEDKPTYYYYDDDEYEDEYYPEDSPPQNEQTKDFVNTFNKKDEASKTKDSEIQDEVNFNGGFDMSIENLKEQFPSGRWPQEKNTAKTNDGKQKSSEDGKQYSGRPVPIHVLSRPLNDNNYNSNNYNSDTSRSNELGNEKESDRVIHILDHGPESPTDIGQLNPSNLEEIIRQQQGQNGIPNNNKHHVQEHQIFNKRVKRNLLQKFQQVKIGQHL